VRRFSTLFGLMVLVLANPGAALGGVATPVSASLPETAPVRITPHRAVYKIRLEKAKNASAVSNVSGKMSFEWKDVCDGWAIQQKMQLHFGFTDGNDQDIDGSELTWEAKDGKRYSFNIRRMADGQETEAYRGKAVQNADGTVTAFYTAPEEKTEDFPAKTLFPTAHTTYILEQAAHGERFFSRRVFDGSDEEGASDISAFILTAKAAAKEPPIAKKLKKNPLLSGAAWPVHLAFFKDSTETGEPDYEMYLNLFLNGIARHMKIDYGDFSVIGTLEEVQALKPQSCP